MLFSTSISKNTDIQITKYNLSTKLFFGIAESRDDFYLTQRRKGAKNLPLAFVKNLNSSRIYATPLYEVTINSVECKHLAHTTQQTLRLSPQNYSNLHAESHDY